jgi:hypothetical protein
VIDVIVWLNEFGITPPWVVLSVFFIAVFGVGRLARLITYDAFPPMVWWRLKWAKLTAKPDGSEGKWEKLFTCYWCLTPWLMLIALVVLGLSWDTLWLALVWLGFLGWFALSYVTSMVVDRDERD